MRSRTQDKITFELVAGAGADTLLADRYPRIVTLVDHAADAFRKLFDAKHFGVHKSMIKPDAYARLDQAGIHYTFFMNSRRGTEYDRSWVRLAFPHWLSARIIEGGE